MKHIHRNQELIITNVDSPAPERFDTRRRKVA
jgi:hypothetical protein